MNPFIPSSGPPNLPVAKFETRSDAIAQCRCLKGIVGGHRGSCCRDQVRFDGCSPGRSRPVRAILIEEYDIAFRRRPSFPWQPGTCWRSMIRYVYASLPAGSPCSRGQQHAFMCKEYRRAGILCTPTLGEEGVRGGKRALHIYAVRAIGRGRRQNRVGQGGNSLTASRPCTTHAFRGHHQATVD